MTVTTKDNLAIVILCSNLGYDPNDEKTTVKPFTVAAFNKLIEKLNYVCVTPEIFLREKLNSLSGMLGLTDDETERIEKLMLRADKLGEEIERLAEMKIYITTRTADNYPTKLLQVMGKNAPMVLYYCGDMKMIEDETVAIIGSREVAEQESEYAKKHARISALNGVTVVSGGAKGIDTIAKESALKSSGRVVTFVSDGMTKYINDNANYILWDKMLVISAFHPDMSFRAYNALERNKFVYASSDYAVVVSSGDETGGSFKGAVNCLKQKLTKLYVKNDEFATVGNKKLIELGGLPVNEEHERLM